MEIFKGNKIHGGIAIGTVLFYSREKRKIVRRRVEDTQAELSRLNEAKRMAAVQLEELCQKAREETDSQNAQIFEAHLMMLEDYDLNTAIANVIESQSVSAEYAAAVTGDSFASRFENMDDEYFRARGEDIRDVTERIIDALMGGVHRLNADEPSIIAAQNLTPSETLRTDKTKLLAFVTQKGTTSSHTAILARAMDIPAVSGIEVRAEWDKRTAVVDGHNGIFILEPDEETLESYREQQKKDAQHELLLKKYKGIKTTAKNGRRINLYANVGSLDDIDAALQNDAEGIGLFRTEFIFMERAQAPTEQQQFEIYRKAAQKMAGRRVIIRTLDIGADKQLPYISLGKEDNPALGCRAVRLCLARPELFKTQLRAIFRASVCGNISVMYPMITSVEEVQRIKQLVQEVKAELRNENIPYKETEQGIMIETPAAALISGSLAGEVDFFSIGTNDLTQYTLAADRQNSRLAQTFNPHHEAVMRLIKMTIENAHSAGIWAGICGELASDLSITQSLIDMGADELSVSPGMVLRVRKAVSEA